MIGAVVQNLIVGFLRPRASVRRILEGGHGLDVALQMVLLAYLVREIVLLNMPGVQLQTEGSAFAHHFQALMQRFASFFVLAVLVAGVGRFFGGAGTWRDTLLAMAWYLVVTSLIAPFVLPAVLHMAAIADAAQTAPIEPVQIPAGPLLMFTVSSGLMLWLFACYVAELHRFARTWNVVAVVLGLSAALSFTVMALLPAS